MSFEWKIKLCCDYLGKFLSKGHMTQQNDNHALLTSISLTIFTLIIKRAPDAQDMGIKRYILLTSFEN